MAKWYPLKTNFTSGEISPLFSSREETVEYATGVEEMLNQVAVAQGATQRRDGTNYLAEVTEDEDGLIPSAGGRLFPFKRGPEENYIGVMGGGRMVLLTEDDARVDLNIVQNPSFVDGNANWDIDVTDGRWPIKFKDEQAWFGSQHNGSMNPTKISYARQTCDVPEASDEVRLSLRGTYIPRRYQVWLELRVSTVAYGQDDVYFTDLAKGGEAGYTIARDITLDLPAGYTGPVYVEFKAIQKMQVRDYIDSLVKIDYIDILVRQTVTPSEIPVVTVPYTDAQLEAIQFVESPYTRQIVFVHPDVAPQELVLSGTTWTFQTIAFTGGVEPDFVEGYPRAVGSYQGRLWFGASYAHPQRVWGSRSGDWYDFEIDSSPEADDPILFTMTYVGEIQWIVGQKGLLIGTSNAEYLVSASSGIIQAGDINVQDQSRYGSAHVQPANIGDQIIFVTGDRQTLRSLEYNRNYQGWMSPDITFKSEHITKAGVRRICYSRDPEKTLWLPVGDGNVIGCNYERTQQLIGFNFHDFNGRVIDGSIIRKDGIDTPVFIIERSIDGVRRYFVEAMVRYKGNPVYLDSSSIQQLGTPSAVVSDLDHLKGYAVQVVGDDSVYPDTYLVDSSGEITIDPPASNVQVGLTYDSRITFLPMESRQRGGGLGAKKARPVIGLRLFESGQPFINGNRPSPDTATNQVPEIVERFTGDVEISAMGVDGIQTFNVLENTPRPMTIIGVYGKNVAENT